MKDSFARHYRKEQISKGQTVFENPASIQRKRKDLLEQLKKEYFLQDYRESEKIDRAAYYFAELNYIHPFREGNGRATREFMRQLFLLNGFSVDWSKVDREDLLDAMEESIYDTTPLKHILSVCLSQI